MGNKDIMTMVCTKAFLLHGKKYGKKEYMRQYTDEDILPSKRQLRQWRINSAIKDKIKSGQIEIDDDLGIFTSSFLTGLRDSGVFQEPLNKRFRFNGNAHKEFAIDLTELKLPIKLSTTYKNGVINISNCSFLHLGVNSNKYNWNEYIGGLFTGCRINQNKNDKWLIIMPKSDISFKRVISVFSNYNIVYEVKRNKIYISPYYGALFFGYMPIHSATRIISIRKAYQGAKLALVYWHMVRKVGQPVAPPKAQILPYALSYASYWNSGILKKTDIREMGVDMGIIGISDELRALMNEWIRYHS